MGFFTLLRNTFSGNNTEVLTTAEAEATAEQLAIARFSIECAVSLIAKTVAMAQFEFRKGNELVCAEDWFRWNYEPNRNQNKQQFFWELCRKWLLYGEALVVEPGRNKGMFVADGFIRDTNGFGNDIFSSIDRDGVSLNAKYRPQDVLYFRGNNTKLRGYLNDTATQYVKLLACAEKKYKKNSTQKGILSLGASIGGTEKQEEKDQAYGQKLAAFLDSDKSAVMTLRKGHEYTELGKYHNPQSAEDIPLLTKEIFARTAEAFGIPTALLLCSGEATATKENVEQFLSFAIRPLLDQIEAEVTRKEIGLNAVKKGMRFTANDATCRHVNPLDVADAQDKLIASGAFCVDEVRNMLHTHLLNTEWSRKHYITRNYQPIESAGKEGSDDGKESESRADDAESREHQNTGII